MQLNYVKQYLWTYPKGNVIFVDVICEFLGNINVIDISFFNSLYLPPYKF